MSKTIKVIDLLNMIANGEIKEGQRFNIKFGDMYRECYFTTDEDKEYCGGLDFFKNCSDNYSVYDSLTLNEEVELIEEQQEIDIQSMREVTSFGIKQNQEAINKLIKAVKQLDKRKEK